ncbi:MAG: YbjQ family protein [Gammaproteobacteria bacterium]|nr:YbjQ family protein [Gammaproteobacteria bacterium]
MLDVIVFLTLLGLGYFFGQYFERRHYQSILKRERETLHFPLFNLKTTPPNLGRVNAQLVTGNVVISVDYFKRFLAGLRTMVGGRVKSYETLLDRARREAILRMKEQAMAQGAIVVTNLRIETSSISKGRRQAIGSIEVLAYGTAITPQRS